MSDVAKLVETVSRQLREVQPLCGCAFGLSENLRINKKCPGHEALSTLEGLLTEIAALPEKWDLRADFKDPEFTVGMPESFAFATAAAELRTALQGERG